MAIGWYLAESGRRKVPYLRNLSGDPRIFDPHVRINGRWVPLDHLLSGAPSVPQRAWFGPRH